MYASFKTKLNKGRNSDFYQKGKGLFIIEASRFATHLGDIIFIGRHQPESHCRKIRTLDNNLNSGYLFSGFAKYAKGRNGSA
jgi:hypothetical protein